MPGRDGFQGQGRFREFQYLGADVGKKSRELAPGVETVKSQEVHWSPAEDAFIDPEELAAQALQGRLSRRTGIQRKEKAMLTPTLAACCERRIRYNQQSMTKNALTKRKSNGGNASVSEDCLAGPMAARVSVRCMSVGIPVPVLTAVPVLVTVATVTVTTVTSRTRRRRGSLSTA